MGNFIEKIKLEFASITLVGGFMEVVKLFMAVALLWILEVTTGFGINPLNIGILFWIALSLALVVTGMVTRAISDATDL